MKLAFVIQRYGKEVSGGSEYLCRLLAEHLQSYYDVEVITTCAKDYLTWRNEYNEGIEHINNVLVRRFKNDFERTNEFHDVYRGILGGRTPNEFKNHFNEIRRSIERAPISEQLRCIKMQGPYSSELLEYLNSNSQKYDFIIFFSYLYPTTYFGIQKVPPEKTLLVPTAHDEPIIYFEVFKEVFNKPSAIAYNTFTEKTFVEKRFHNEHITNIVVGIGVDFNEQIISDDWKNPYGDYIVYCGRIDILKCNDLFEYFLKYKKNSERDLKLVLVGKAEMEIPGQEDIIHTGFVSEEDKFNIMNKAKVLINPSKYESFSMVLMESWLCKIPVLINKESKVMKDHCLRSNAGLYYANYDEFASCLDLLLSDKKLREKLGKNGKEYVEKNYNWKKIEKKYIKLLENLNYGVSPIKNPP